MFAYPFCFTIKSEGGMIMFGNPYYNNNIQTSIDRLDNQIKELENMRSQLQMRVPQPPIMGVIDNLQKQINELKGRLDDYEEHNNANHVRETKDGEPTGVSNDTTNDAE